MKKAVSGAAILLVAGHCFAQTPNNVDHEFSVCVSNEAKTGSYTSYDGGISAVKILERCESSYTAWMDSCRVQQPLNSCVTKASVIAQVALRMNGK